jgi:glucans biosynthesis protein C
MIKENQRIHGIDALRAIAMILGILFHATIAYKVIAVPTWPHDNEFNHGFFDFIYFAIHSFRMPLFFLIAGYFCRFLYYRVGEKAFIRHRWQRIGIPFIVSMIFILPLTIFPFLVAQFSYEYPGDRQKVLKVSFQNLFQWNGMAHLWFLYYLLIYYVTVVLLQKFKSFNWFNSLCNTISGYWKRSNQDQIAWVFILTIPVWIILLFSKALFPAVDTGILPDFYYLAFYAYFFALGWLVNIKPSLFNVLMKRVWLLLFAGLILMGCMFYMEWRVLPQAAHWVHIAAKVGAAFQVIFLVLAGIGFFLKFFNVESQTWKYVSDASYWMYLIHLGLVAGLQILFMNSVVPGFLRFPLVLLITLIISLLSYHFLVRYTILGTYLHGKKRRK